MKRVMMTGVGKPADVLALVDEDLPRPGPGQVRVRVLARPINPADLLLIEGRHLVRPRLPAAVGIEGAGVISAVGEGVDAGFAPGQKVALPFGGTWAEEVCIAAAEVIPLPEHVDIRQAAMLSVNPITALGLTAGLEAGDWLVQNAATSAVGRLVTRVARARGVRSISVVRRHDVAGELMALGADAVLVDSAELATRVREVTAGGARRALDAVSGEAAGRLLSSLRAGGELVCYGLLASNQVVLPAAELVFRDVHVRGYSRLHTLGALGSKARRKLLDEALALLAAGTFDSVIERAYPLEEVHAAVAHVAMGGRRGKILLVSEGA